MKFSKTILLTLVVGILLIAVAALYSFHYRQVEQRELLEVNVNTLQRTLPLLATEKRSMEPQLTQLETKLKLAQTALQDAERRFPATVDNLEYSEALSQLAHDTNLKVLALANSTATTEQSDEINNDIYRFDLAVSGKLSDILSFIERLNASPLFESAQLDELELSNLDSEEPHLAISIVVYTYMGG